MSATSEAAKKPFTAIIRTTSVMRNASSIQAAGPENGPQARGFHGRRAIVRKLFARFRDTLWQQGSAIIEG
jgi:hypothetical protein